MKKKLVLLVAAAAASVLPMTASASAAPAAGDPTKTIAEQASADPQFSTLVAALGAADLVGPFDACTDAKTTVFAPTNDAKNMAKLMLPRERSRTMVTLISDVAGSRGWSDFIPALCNPPCPVMEKVGKK